MWKHLIKPTYYNFKGEPKPPTQSPVSTQAKTFTHSSTHSPQIIKEEPARVIEPARSERTALTLGNQPKEKNIEPEKLETGEESNKQKEVRQTKSRKKKKKNS